MIVQTADCRDLDCGALRRGVKMASVKKRLAFILALPIAAALPVGPASSTVSAITVARRDQAAPGATALPRIAPAGDRSAFVLAPGRTATLAVRAVTAAGKPLARRTVRF